MLLFVLWATLMLAVLAGAGYSHYRYRVRNNQYYERLFAKNGVERDTDEAPAAHRSYALPVIILIMVFLLVPISLII